MSTDTVQAKVKKGSYKVRCLDCKEGRTGKGFRQFTQSFEIFDNVDPALNGRMFKTFQVVEPQSVFYVNNQRQALGLPEVEEGGVVNIQASEYVGQDGMAYLQQKDTPQIDEDGKAICNPYDGTPVVDSVVEVNRWFAKPKSI